VSTMPGRRGRNHRADGIDLRRAQQRFKLP
jgi:hypothetical protein